MLENVLRFIAKFEDKEAHLIFSNGMPIQALENMCLQILQYLGKYKEAQVAASQESALPQEQPVNPVAESKVEEISKPPVE